MRYLRKFEGVYTKNQLFASSIALIDFLRSIYESSGLFKVEDAVFTDRSLKSFIVYAGTESATYSLFFNVGLHRTRIETTYAYSVSTNGPLSGVSVCYFTDDPKAKVYHEFIQNMFKKNGFTVTRREKLQYLRALNMSFQPFSFQYTSTTFNPKVLEEIKKDFDIFQRIRQFDL